MGSKILKYVFMCMCIYVYVCICDSLRTAVMYQLGYMKGISIQGFTLSFKAGGLGIAALS